MMLGGGKYSIDYAINGKKQEPLLVKEAYIERFSATMQDSIVKYKDNKAGDIALGYVVKGGKGKADSFFVLSNKVVKVAYGRQASDGILPTCQATIFDIILPLVAYLAFFCGILQLLIDSGASDKLASFISPLFVKIFPDVPAKHPSISYMTLNFAANFLGLDSAATPFGLKAMESLQELNPNKEKASNAQIMFLCLHAAGLTLIPTSIIGYRAAQHAANPADVMLPCIITSFVGTIAALVFVGIRQRINFRSSILILSIFSVMGLFSGLLWYIASLGLIEKNHFTNNVSSIILLCIILFILVYAMMREKTFSNNGMNVFASFVEGAGGGLKTGLTIFPYVLGMLVAISLFRNSGLFDIISAGVSKLFLAVGMDKQTVDAIPVALLRPFSSSGARGFMIDSMRSYGPDSFTGRLSCVFQCAAETTFYVIAVYFGSVKIKDTRYTLSAMLFIDLICVIAGVWVSKLFF